MTDLYFYKVEPILKQILQLNIMKVIGKDVITIETETELKKLDTNSKLLLITNDTNIKLNNQDNLLLNSLNLPWEEIILELSNLLSIKIDFNSNLNPDPFIPVSIDYFLNYSTAGLKCDVFIRVKKNETEFQYIKRINADDHITIAEVEKYKKSGLGKLYITSNQFSLFVNFFTHLLECKRLETTNFTEENFSMRSGVYGVTLERIHTLGIDENTVALVNENIESLEKSLHGNKVLSTFISALQSNKMSYAYSHMYFISLILHKILGQFQWESPQIRKKLIYITFFHDIGLKQSNLAKINNAYDLENSDLTQDEKKDILNHALNSASIIDRFPDIPLGISSIIKEHHGTKSGIGFSESQSITIAPLSIMFIIVEEFVDDFLKKEYLLSQEELSNILFKISKKYTKQQYQSTITALENMLKKNN